MDDDFGRMKTCLHPRARFGECQGPIVRAHTLQRRRVLSEISRDGHVYAFVPRLVDLTKSDGRARPFLTGISRASVFDGFCKKHDKQFFSPLEDRELGPSDEQILLLCYRAASLELFKKLSTRNFFSALQSRSQGLTAGGGPEIVGDFAHGLDLGIRDIERLKNRLDASIERGGKPEVGYALVEFDRRLPIVSTGAFAPETDFQGRILQCLGHEAIELDMLAIALVPTGGGSALIFGWPKGSPSCEAFAASLFMLPDGQLASAAIQLAFEHVENTYADPDWWDTLPAGARALLLGRLESGASIIEPRDRSVLIPDGAAYFDAGVTRIRLERG